MEDGIMVVVGINVGLLGVFVVSFFLFSSNTTGLERKNRMINKLLTRCHPHGRLGENWDENGSSFSGKFTF